MSLLKLQETTDMRMLKRIKGVNLGDKVRSGDIKRELGVCDIFEKSEK